MDRYVNVGKFKTSKQLLCAKAIITDTTRNLIHTHHLIHLHILWAPATSKASEDKTKTKCTSKPQQVNQHNKGAIH